jgi:hypothetical protein
VTYSHYEFPALTRAHIEGASFCATRNELIALLPVPKGGVVAEVGVAHGEFSEILLRELAPSRFVAIDIFTMHHMPVAWGIPTAVLFNGMTHLDFYRKKFAAWGEQVVIEEGWSHDMLTKQPDNSFDLLYIDASHDYDNVKRDGSLGLQKLKNTGVLVFNDYIMYDHVADAPYGVVQAVNELVIDNDLQVIGFSLQRHMFCDIAVRRRARPYSSSQKAKPFETFGLGSLGRFTRRLTARAQRTPFTS